MLARPQSYPPTISPVLSVRVHRRMRLFHRMGIVGLILFHVKHRRLSR